MLNPVAMSIITNIFTDPAGAGPGHRRLGRRGRHQPGARARCSAACWSTRSAGASIFWVNVPDRAGRDRPDRALFVPESRAARARRLDPVGQVLVILIARLRSPTAIIEGPRAAGRSRRSSAVRARSAAALVGLLLYEPRRHEPLLDLRFFRSVPFSGATVIAVCAFAALGGFLFLNTLYLQDVRGFSPLHAGLLHAADGADDRGLRARCPGGSSAAGSAPAAGGRRGGHGGQRADADPADQRHPGRLADAGLRGVRRRLRPGQRADHQRRRLRHAASRRPGWPPRSPRPAGRSASRSASRWSARW